MATVIWGGSVARQPAQGEMRRFIVRQRLDARGASAIPADINKVILVKGGWFVKNVWAKVVVPSSGTYGYGWIIDGAGESWGTTFTACGLLATAGLNGTSTPYYPYTVSQKGVSGGQYYVSDTDLRATFVAGATFDGVLDVFADVIDTNPYESPAAFSD